MDRHSLVYSSLYYLILISSTLPANHGALTTSTDIDDEGIVEMYILAREEVDNELEEFYKTAPAGLDPDPNSEAMENLRNIREQIIKLGLPEQDLADLLKGDPGLIGRSKRGVRYRSIQRRAIDRNEQRRWTGGIVPYVFTQQIKPNHAHEIRKAMATYQRFTCLRYVPWEKVDGVTTNEKLNLDHPSYLSFIKASGCWSFLGNIWKETGQKISCCGGTTCIHEIGHAMGESHEQQSPNPDRYRFIGINFDNIKPDYVSSYAPHLGSKYFSSGYDLSTYMHYSQWTFRKPGKNTYVKYFPELPNSNSHYYLMREVSVMHKCQDKCSHLTITCENDGYLTLVDDKCSCRCIQGLDPATGCTTIYKADPPGMKFPGGKYTLPAHRSGCPDDSFALGSRTQYNDGGNKNSSNYALGGDISDKQVEQQFCSKTPDGSDWKWPGADFCVYRKGGKCPKGFDEGFVQYNDRPTSTERNAVSGELPDGVFDENTRLEFCCQNMGFSNDELYLPSRKPFVLIKHPKKECHQVRGMHFEHNDLRIVNTDDAGSAKEGGVNPVYKVEKKTNAYWTRFCHYKPAMIDCGDIINLDASSPEVTISSPDAPELECYWLIKAPAGQKLQLDFSSFDIKGKPGNCKDRLEVRYVRPGQPGVVYCGQGWDRTTISINNTIHLRMSTFGESTSHFTATVKLVNDADMCYSVADRGMTYDGNINFTRHFETCIPWHEASHCGMHSFKADKFSANLDSNKCRNPDQATGFMPWCYTNAEKCLRNYCDVCLLGKRFDSLAKCEDLKAAGQCVKEGCAKTCEDQWGQTSTPVKASQVACSTPGDAPDGTPVDPLKDLYSVGEWVTYKCNDGDTTKKRFCLTSGQWSSMGSVCTECPKAFTLNTKNSQCYFYPKVKTDFSKAMEKCQEDKAFVAYPKNADENLYLNNLTSYRIWLGITDQEKEGKFVTVEGKEAEFFNWASTEPNDYRKREDCTELKTDGEWNDSPCYYKRHFICQKAMTVINKCLDFSDKCTSLFAAKPSMCTDFPDFAEKDCRYTCGLCDLEGSPKCTIEKAGEAIKLYRGMFASFSCEEGYIRISGNEVRGCTASGTITGSPLECTKECPSGWTTNPENFHCYKKFNTKKTFPEAKADCEAQKGIVATAKNKQEQDIVNSVRNSGDIWLGMSDEITEKDWIWIDGDLVLWFNWNKWEPNDYGKSGEDCAMMKGNSQWNDMHCTKRQYPYVCKVPLSVFNSSK
ncbi:metalloendopeptidase [Plakobranchus ocellatus]|uniref:Metalloendopeptidase n=1 Tax=Plakobranchus ocellatus TaxID=259542 RepID=A0AAV4CH75_9GAST|nr:metalloendopeptidase [Plakobranchus ocellatus]